MIEYNLHVIDTHRLGSRGRGWGSQILCGGKERGIGGGKMKSEPRDKGPLVTHTHTRIGIFWFSRIP